MPIDGKSKGQHYIKKINPSRNLSISIIRKWLNGNYGGQWKAKEIRLQSSGSTRIKIWNIEVLIHLKLHRHSLTCEVLVPFTLVTRESRSTLNDFQKGFTFLASQLVSPLTTIEMYTWGHFTSYVLILKKCDQVDFLVTCS